MNSAALAAVVNGISNGGECADDGLAIRCAINSETAWRNSMACSKRAGERSGKPLNEAADPLAAAVLAGDTAASQLTQLQTELAGDGPRLGDQCAIAGRDHGD